MISILGFFRAAARRAIGQTNTNSDVLLCDNTKTDASNNKSYKVSLTTLASKLFALINAGEAVVTPLIDDGDAGVTVTSANQTHAAPTVTIPDIGDAADSFVMNDTAATLTNKTINGGKLTRNVQTISGDGAITIQSGIVLLTKGSIAAITLAAPSSQDGTEITITSTTDFAHVVTVTGGMWDGTATTNTTVTFPVVAGGAVTLIAFGTDWYVTCIQGVTVAP